MISDYDYMKRALSLAQKGHPAPNPCVGAVLVKDGKIIGEGYHECMGSAHAEIVAIHASEKHGPVADGATLYVTLEPCAHFGKTPPCIDSIIFSGITRVVIGCKDQNPVSGDGIGALKEAGIVVEVGILGQECADFYAPFFHYIHTKMPFVTLKSAMTLDRKIAAKRDEQLSITGKQALNMAHQLRAQHDAVLVGIGTILTDDSQLTCRRVKCNKQPLRVIMDSTLRIPLNAKVLENNHVVIATTQGYDKKKFKALRKKGVKFIVTNGKKVNVKALLEALPALGVLTLLVEGGAAINRSFLAKKLVNRMCFFVSQKKLGNGLDVFDGFRGADMEKVHSKKVGKDVFMQGTVTYA